MSMEEAGREDIHREPTAADRAVQKVTQNITDLQPAFLAVGITQQQLDAARVEAEKRVREEYRALELQDPVSVLENALQRAAQTEEERIYLQYQWGLNTLRQKVLRNEFRQGINNESSDYLRDSTGRLVPYLSASLLSGLPLTMPDTHEVVARPSGELMKRFLGEIVGGGQTLEELLTSDLLEYDDTKLDRSNHEWNQPPLSKPFILTGEQGRKRYVTHVPTKIEGVELRINTDSKRPSVDALFTAEALKRIRIQL